MEKLLKLIKKNIPINLGLVYISQNPNLTMEIINKYPDKPWSLKNF